MEKHNYIILSDAASDLSPELRKRFGIDGYIQTYISTPKEEDIPSRLDMSDAELDAFYAALKSNKNGYKTSAPSVDEVVLYFESFFKQGNDILTVSLSSKLSATYNVILQAKKIVCEKYPERKAVIVDSLKYSLGSGLLAIKASELRAQGLSIDENAKALDRIKTTLHHMGPIDDLFWVASKGRISHAKAFFGTMLGVKPMGDFGPEGMVTVLGKATGIEKALKVTVEYIKKTIKSEKEQIILVAHTARRKQAQTLAQLIEEKIKPKEVMVCNIYPMSGINAGPGIVAAFYYGTEITDLAYEKQILNEIIVSKS